MEGTIRSSERELGKLKRVVNVNHLGIKFLSYTRLQPNTPIGYSEVEVFFTYFNVDDVFQMGLLLAGEGKDMILGPVSIDFP